MVVRNGPPTDTEPSSSRPIPLAQYNVKVNSAAVGSIALWLIFLAFSIDWRRARPIDRRARHTVEQRAAWLCQLRQIVGRPIRTGRLFGGGSHKTIACGGRV